LLRSFGLSEIISLVNLGTSDLSWRHSSDGCVPRRRHVHLTLLTISAPIFDVSTTTAPIILEIRCLHLRNHRLLLTFLPPGLSRSHSLLPLLTNDLLLRHLSGLKLRSFLPTHLSWRLTKFLLRLSLDAHLLLRLPKLTLWLRLRTKDLLRLTVDALLLRLRLRTHLRHLPKLRLLSLRHLPYLLLWLRPHLGLLPHLWLTAAAATSRRWAAALLLGRRTSTVRVAAAPVALTLTENVLIQTADKQKAKRDRSNKLL
jgi:hypothetical protein